MFQNIWDIFRSAIFVEYCLFRPDLHEPRELCGFEDKIRHIALMTALFTEDFIGSTRPDTSAAIHKHPT